MQASGRTLPLGPPPEPLDPILATKISISGTRSPLVGRPRLLKGLDRVYSCRLVLVSAPAGFGKTTLLSSWATQTDQATARRNDKAWYALDDGDNNLPRFLHYLIAALQQIEPLIGQDALRRAHDERLNILAAESLDAPESLPESLRVVEPILTSLINDLVALDHEIVLILDDYHVITRPAIHAAMGFLLDHAPRSLHVVIASRADPPLALARLRARGLLLELRVADLRFTSAEVEALFQTTYSIMLPPEHIAALEKRTEGWVAALQLVALSGAFNGADPTEHLKMGLHEDVAVHRFIADYLIEEVLAGQSAELQAFVMQTAILDRLCGPLCDAVTGDVDGHGQVMLERLEQINLFTRPLDNHRRWYCYHQLFADVLQERLQRLQPDAIPELHRRAAGWYAAQADPRPSAEYASAVITHYLAANDPRAAAAALERYARVLFDAGLGRSVIAWLDQLPEDLMQSLPGICLLHAGALILAGQAEQERLSTIERRLQSAQQALNGRSGASGEQYANVRAILPAITAFVQGDVHSVQNAIAQSRQSLTQLDQLDQIAGTQSRPQSAIQNALRAALFAQLGEAHWLSGDMQTAQQLFTDAIGLHRQAGDLQASLLATYRLGHLQTTSGQLKAAAATLRAAMHGIDENDPQVRPALSILGLMHGGLSALMVERDDLDTAEYHAQRSVQISSAGGEIPALVVGFIAVARVQSAQGDTQAALDSLERGQTLARKHVLPARIGEYLTALEARVWLKRREVAKALEWERGCGLTFDDETLVSPEHEFEALTYARLLLAQADTKASANAVRVLRVLAEATAATGRLGRMIESLALLAVAEQKDGQRAGGSTSLAMEQAAAALEAALAQAEPEDYVRSFTDIGVEGAQTALTPLLRHFAEYGPHTEYAQTLLESFDSAEPPTDQSTPNGGSEAAGEAIRLSEREMELMTLIAAGLSNQEIAARLVVTPETIKWHIKNIYRKLDVNSRTQAINRAKSAGLLG